MNCYLIVHFHFFLHFLHNMFFLLMKFLNTSSWRKIHSIKLSRNGHQKMFLSIYWRNVYVWMLVYDVVYVCVCVCVLCVCVCVWSWKVFMIIFVMFVNEEVCEIVLIINSCTDYEFSAAILIFKLLMWNPCRYRQAGEL